MLLTVLGHAGGLLVPAGVTRAFGVPDAAYHALAFGVGGLAGVAAVVGLGILGYRRFAVRTVGGSGAPGDAAVFVLLPATAVAGLGLTLFGGEHDYRASVAPWLRSILLLRPEGELMAGAPVGFQVHTLLALALIASWPFTRLVHAFTAPVGYLVRPYIVYRSRGPAPPLGRPVAARVTSRHTTGHHALSQSRSKGSGHA
jgi:nitrate reductase gamma subunit